MNAYKQILLIHKKSTLTLMEESNEDSRKYLQTFPKRHAELQRAHHANLETIESIKSFLAKNNIAYTECYRANVCTDILNGIDLIISIGGDGTLLDVSKVAEKVPILGVNSDPVKSTGFFCHATKETFPSIFSNLDAFPKTILPRMKLFINNEEFEHPILNDVFLTNKNHADMVRLEATVDNNNEGSLFFRSSGVLISTSSGSTAWMYNEGGEIMQSEDTRLQYRESGNRFKKGGFVSKSIEFTSHMYAGIIAIDGSHQLKEFTFGTKIRLEPGAPPLTVFGDVDAKKAIILGKNTKT